MVEFSEYVLGAAAQRVIEGGQGIQQEQGGAVDAEADDLPRIALLGGEDHQHDEPGQGQGGADQVRDGVEAFAVIHR